MNHGLVDFTRISDKEAAINFALHVWLMYFSLDITLYDKILGATVSKVTCFTNMNLQVTQLTDSVSSAKQNTGDSPESIAKRRNIDLGQ